MAAGATEAADAAAGIAAEGRAVTLIKLDETPADTSKPWRGSGAPRATPAISAAVSAVFVPPGGSFALGYGFTITDDMKRAEQVAIVGPGAGFAYDATTFDEILDSDGSRWKIIKAEVLKPASTAILFFMWVKR